MRWQHCLAHADSIQTPVKSPDCLLGVVTQPSDSRLSETSTVSVLSCYTIRVRALCVEEPQLGLISSGHTVYLLPTRYNDAPVNYVVTIIQ